MTVEDIEVINSFAPEKSLEYHFVDPGYYKCTNFKTKWRQCKIVNTSPRQVDTGATRANMGQHECNTSRY